MANDQVAADPVAPVDGAGITTGSLARRLGVSPTTLRSWDQRYGLGPAVRPVGRHRRWSADDVAMLEEMCRLTAAGAPPGEAARVAKERARAGHPQPAVADAALPLAAPGGAALPLGVVRAECRGLARAAVRLDSEAVQEHLNAFVREHGVVAAWEEVMMPTLHAVGRKWETSGDRYVEVEHLLSWHVSTTLRNAPLLLGGRARVHGVAPILLACVPGEQHTLPLEAVYAALVVAGLPVRMLGAAVPAEALTESVRRTGPSAVMLWSQSRSSASTPLAAHLVRTAWGLKGARQRPLVHLAGPGWGPAPVEGTKRPGGLREAMTGLAGPAAR
ncbi:MULTISPECIES: MerR family transcriptional regulator [unclassified Streptomyces]|uniref:MerR family transcriptional regulator n=1 Tax=unclassified Streptomyces TaxID=2593676 RepID=UPI001F439475|nr:MerR family transcriptional regulator [Streptomyces sp. HmicA12]